MGYAKWHFHQDHIDFTIRVAASIQELNEPQKQTGEEDTPCLPDAFFWAFQLHWELLVGQDFFLNNKFVWNELFTSPQGCPSLSFFLSLRLTFPPSFVLTAFIPCLHMHSPTLPQEFHWGWNLKLQKQDPPHFLCFYMAPAPNLLFINGCPPTPHPTPPLAYLPHPSFVPLKTWVS